MLKKKKITAYCLLFVILIQMLLPGFVTEYQAAEHAQSYTNAKVFFNTTGQRDGKHIDINEGIVYFATKGKLAHTYASDYHTYYASRGFDVTLTGGGTSVTFAVKIGVSLEEVQGSADSDAQGYHYQLFKITREKLEELARKANPANAEKVLSADAFEVCMDTIIVRRYAGMEGSIEEDGKGGLAIYSPNNNYRWVWRLKDENQLANARTTYGGHTFDEYRNISKDLENFKLDVYYAVDGLPSISDNSSSQVTVASGWRTANADVDKDETIDMYILIEGSKPKIDTGYLVKSITVLNPLASAANGGPAISKTGYHLDKEVTGKEWITKNGRTFTAGGTYNPKDLEPAVGSGSTSICLYANWKANEYTFVYYANGGSGTTSSSIHTYDKAKTLTQNGYTRDGYTFKGWSRTENGPVKYTDKQVVINESTVNGDVIKLYAVWEKNVYEITLNDDVANVPRSGVMYERYEKGFYSDENCNTEINEVKKPEKTGYTFDGYYDFKNGGGAGYINGEGKITASNTDFKCDKTIYAKWVANTYTIHYHLGIENASLADSPAIYDKDVTLRPNVYAKRGYTFAGWARTEGGEVVYTDKETVRNITSVNGAEIDLYAVWEPITAQITLDPQEGSGGTGFFYEKFGVNFYTNSSLMEVLDKINIPSRTGYDFKGYFADIIGLGTPLIGETGIFGIDSTYFVQDSMLFAKWTAKTYTLTLNKEGGVGGTDSITATYDKLVPGAESTPPASAPKRNGFEFKGYYTERNGNGTKFYNEFMYSDILYKSTEDTQLYAYWVDNYAPEISLNGKQPLIYS